MSDEAFRASPKPAMLMELRKALFRTENIIYSAAEQKKAIETIREITPKLNKGGLASRK